MFPSKQSTVHFSEASTLLWLYLFYDKECNNFPTHLAEFSNQTLFSKGVKVASAVLYSLIKHAKISQSQCLLELLK